jgi:hypothetical protein
MVACPRPRLRLRDAAGAVAVAVLLRDDEDDGRELVDTVCARRLRSQPAM